MRVDRFEDLIAWQRACDWCREIYRITAIGGFAKDFGLKDQSRRAAVSVVSNLAEGFERAKRPEFHQFVCIAKGSCAEVRSHLYIALDCGCPAREQFETPLNMGLEIARLLGALRKSLESPTKRAVQSSVRSPQS